MSAKLKLFARNRMAVFGAIVFLFMLFLTIASAFLFPKGAFGLSGPPLQPPGDAFLLGTDSLGRDVAAGVAYGARASLLIGVLAALSAVVLGALVGAFAGYCRGNVDVALMRVTEFFQTIPAFLLAIILVAVLQPSLWAIVLALGVTSWTGVARLTRGEFLALREREFVRAAEALGASPLRLMVREILPNALTPIIVSTALLVANAILSEAGLAFLGLGDPNHVSWGSMVGSGREALRTAWYMTALPGAAVMLTVLALNLLGDALNTALNPRLAVRRRAQPAVA